MFDLIVVTAANDAQAKGYRAQLRGRANFVVVPDPGNRRVGSLGATVNVLRGLLVRGQKGRKGPKGQKRLLICHSGGDAKRTPGYAAMGKAFVPMADGRPMLDHIVEAMEKLPAKEGVTVCCGDVIPYLDSGKVAFAEAGVTGVAYPDGPWQAQRHGVYVVGEDRKDRKDGKDRKDVVSVASVVSVLEPVADFLQKPQVNRGRFLIDTGILHFDWKTAAKMTKLPIAGDIYEEFPKMLLEGFAPFHVSVVPKCDFFHIGSSRELLSKLGGRQGGRGLQTACRKPNVLIDGVAAPLGKLGGDNVVTNVPAEYGRIDLKRGECLTSLPLGKSEWYHLKYRIDDNFKSDGLWEKHGLGDKMKRVNHARLLKLRSNTETQRHRGLSPLNSGAGETPPPRKEANSWGGAVTAAQNEEGFAITSVFKMVRVTAPVRIDFAGGWSDTPPICQKEGGTVLAAAVTLDGKRPIEVTVRPRRDKFVKVISKDLGKRKLIRSAAEIADHHDPYDWCCLVKSALSVTGFRFGERGLDITISADLPKGSGMGTSSILGAATIAALLASASPRGRVGSGDVDVAKVGALTLKLEQEMRTGGGWEDQFAGMTPGVKVLRSRPGAEQSVAVESVRLPSKFARELKSRSLLYFTGQKRMARNVLRRVLGFYADNPHNFGKILIRSVKRGAEEAARAVARGDLEALSVCINDYWRDKKLLDAGSTNEKVDDIIDVIRPSVSAVTLAGAGGGGFMYILAKTPKKAREIRSFLEKNPPSPASKFYDFDIDARGMAIEFLV